MVISYHILKHHKKQNTRLWSGILSLPNKTTKQVSIPTNGWLGLKNIHRGKSVVNLWKTPDTIP